MRFLITGLFIILLLGCVSTTGNYYTQTIQSWRGGNANNLVQQWGMPDQKITNSSGHTYYVYKTESYRAYNAPATTPVGVNYSRGGRPVIMDLSNTNNTWNRGPSSITCTAIFEADAKGKIISSTTKGQGCYGNQQFANTRMNNGH